MPGWKRAFSYAFAGAFDLLKFIFVLFVFTAPLIIGITASAAASQSSWLSWIPPWMIATAVSGGIAGAEILQPQIAATISSFGIIMATIIGFAGGLFMAIWFWAFCGIPPWKRGGWTLAGWGVSMVPLIDILPTFLLSSWAVVRAEHKADREALKQWEAESASQTRLAEQEQRQRAANAQAQRQEFAENPI